MRPKTAVELGKTFECQVQGDRTNDVKHGWCSAVFGLRTTCMTRPTNGRKLAATALCLGTVLMLRVDILIGSERDVPLLFFPRLGWITIQVAEHIEQRRHF